jgi:hypothetical protein
MKHQVNSGNRVFDQYRVVLQLDGLIEPAALCAHAC